MKRTSALLAGLSCIGLSITAAAQDRGDRAYQAQDQQYEQWYDQDREAQQDLQAQGRRQQQEMQRYGQQDREQIGIYGEGQMAGQQEWDQQRRQQAWEQQRRQQQFRQQRLGQDRQQFGQQGRQQRQQQQFRQPQQDQYGQQWDRYGQQSDQWQTRDQYGQQQFRQGQMAQQRAVALTGRITETDINLGGRLQNETLVRLQTPRGQTVIASLGQQDQVQDLNLQRGQNIFVRGRLTQQDGQRVVLAEEVGMVTQRTTISRAGQDQAQQAGFGQQQDWRQQQRLQQQRLQQQRQQYQQYEDQDGFGVRGEMEFDAE